MNHLINEILIRATMYNALSTAVLLLIFEFIKSDVNRKSKS